MLVYILSDLTFLALFGVAMFPPGLTYFGELNVIIAQSLRRNKVKSNAKAHNIWKTMMQYKHILSFKKNKLLLESEIYIIFSAM